MADRVRRAARCSPRRSKAFNLAGPEAGADRGRRGGGRLPDGAALTTRATRARSRRRRRSATATRGWTRRSRRSPPTTRALPALLPRGRAVARAGAGELPGVAGLPRAGLGDDPGRGLPRARARRAARAGCDFGAPGAGFARLNVGTTPELVRGGRQAPGGGADAVKRRRGLLDGAERAELDHEHHVARGEREVLVVLGRARAVELRHLARRSAPGSRRPGCSGSRSCGSGSPRAGAAACPRSRDAPSRCGRARGGMACDPVCVAAVGRVAHPMLDIDAHPAPLVGQHPGRPRAASSCSTRTPTSARTIPTA